MNQPGHDRINERDLNDLVIRATEMCHRLATPEERSRMEQLAIERDIPALAAATAAVVARQDPELAARYSRAVAGIEAPPSGGQAMSALELASMSPETRRGLLANFANSIAVGRPEVLEKLRHEPLPAALRRLMPAPGPFDDMIAWMEAQGVTFAECLTAAGLDPANFALDPSALSAPVPSAR